MSIKRLYNQAVANVNQMDTLSERIEQLEMEKEDLKNELRAIRSNMSSSQATTQKPNDFIPIERQ